MKWFVTIVATMALVNGCTGDDVQQSDNVFPENNSVAVNASANNTPTNSVDPQPLELQVLVEPVEWGLFEEDVGSQPTTEFDGVVADAEAMTVHLPAGVSRVVFVIDGVRHLLDTGTSLAPPRGSYRLTEGSKGGIVFTPGRAEFEVTSLTAEAVTLRRLSSEPALSPDAPGHVSASTVGSSFDDLLGNYDPTAADRSAIFDLLNSVRLAGGAPVVTDRGLLFIAPGVPGDSPALVGSFNGWTQGSGYELRQLIPGLFARYVELPIGEHSYKIAYGESWTKDQANRHIEWDGIDTQSVGFFNSVVRPNPEVSRLVLWPAFYSPELENQREIYVYLPPDYAQGALHPLLIAHDGNESIVRAQFHEVIDSWAVDKTPEEQPVVAFVALPSQNVRMQEYTFATDGARGVEYGEFLAETLHPVLDSSFRLAQGRTNTGLIGASLGGLISYFVLSEQSDTFGYAAGMSSSFFWADSAMLGIVAQAGCLDASFYLDSGSPNDNFEITRQMRDLLNNEGCRYRYVLDEGGTHDWWKWNERLPGVLDHFASSQR
jgi:enterochelin esterase-like enzyme